MTKTIPLKRPEPDLNCSCTNILLVLLIEIIGNGRLLVDFQIVNFEKCFLDDSEACVFPPPTDGTTINNRHMMYYFRFVEDQPKEFL